MKISAGIGFVLIVVAGLTSCSIEKRHYRDGYYVRSNFGKENVQAAKKDDAAVTVTPQAVENSAEAEIVVPDVSVINLQENKESDVANPIEHSVTAPSADSEIETDQEAKVPQPAPKIETDKKQAMGAGIAASIFFFLGMAGLFITGTNNAVGIFIGAAFLCFLLCVVLACVLYPREPRVMQPKEESSTGDKVGLGIVVALLVASGLLALTFIVWFLNLISIF